MDPAYPIDPRDAVASPRRRAAAAAIAILLPVLSFAAVAGAVERPFGLGGTHSSAAPRAAIAIRDDVIAFQKWGTRSFALPALERGYDRVWYFTETGDPDVRRAFAAAVDEACTSYASVDLFLLAHGNRYVDQVAALGPERTGALRLVYNTGCGDADQSERWLAIGADAYVAHVGVSQSPVFFVYFLRRWVSGARLGDAVDAANARAARVLAIVGWVALSPADSEAMVADSTAVCAGAGGLTIGSGVP